MKDVLISAEKIREHLERVESEVESQKRLRSDGDPFFLHTRWVLDEMRVALRDAQVQYLPTSEVAELTGWSEETLRRHAKALHENKPAPREWAQMIVRRDGGDWTFNIASVPVKRSAAA